MKSAMYGIFTAAVAVLLFGNCSKTPDIHGGKKDEAKQKTLVMTPFEQLNAGKGEMNSHASEWEKSSVKMDFRSYQELGTGNNVTIPTYARVRTLKDGSYILTWQNSVGTNGNGEDTFYALSRDFKTWTYMGYLWQSENVPANKLGSPDTKRYTNANTLQLSNGEILATAAFSTVKSYSNINCKDEQGIVVKRSSDGGYTWFGETVIYNGPCWEPHLMELPSGEIQCFFSESRPWTSSSHSGTDMVLSRDGGATWEPALGNDAYRVMRKHWWNEPLNMYCYTYQMPVGVILNGTNKFAFAMESCNQRVTNANGTRSDQFSIAIVFSNEDGSWTHLQGDEITPREQRIDSVVVRGAAPYLVQFPSGETLLAYGGTDSRQHFRIGNAKADEFSGDIAALPDIGSWGGLDLTSSHSVISCMRDSRDGADNATIALAKFHLNHTIAASRRKAEIDADNSEWENTDEALFVGAKCQAQATLRCSADEDNYYFLVEVFDNTVSSNDFAYIMLAPADGSATLSSKARRVRVGIAGIKSTDSYAGGWKSAEFGVKAAAAYDGSISDNTDIDNGFLAEISIPRSSIAATDGRLLVNFGYFDAMSNVEDALADASTPANWIAIQGL